MNSSLKSVIVGLLFLFIHGATSSIEEDQYGVKYATNCEVCKLVTKEIGLKLEETRSSGVIETGYNLDARKKKTKYNMSELRLLEVLESVCDGMMDYKVHKERQDSTRWAKMMSQTFRTLHGLVNKGVKVDLGIPFELWDKPSAEVSHLKTQCDQFLEDNEESINEWYFNQENPKIAGIQETVCIETLSETDADCLQEPYGETIKSEETDKKEQEVKNTIDDSNSKKSTKKNKKGDDAKVEL